jgi:hypothetical protein
MDCTICGKATLPGAMLCAPCKAALKRARYVTVQEDVRRPSIIGARRKPHRPRPANPPKGPAVATPAPSGSASNAVLFRRLLVGIVVFAVLLGSASYFGQRELGARSHGDASATPESGALAARAAAETPAVVPPAIPAVAPVASDAILPPAKPATVTAKRTNAASTATFATANGDPPDAVVLPPEPEKPAAVPAPPPRPIPDRWQNMRDALAECDHQSMFDGLMCGQRVRIQYCEGYWGKVAQCPGAAAIYER